MKASKPQKRPVRYDSLYGGMPIQIGYCNGHNHLLNAVEYHRDSEINIAVTDMILILGKEQDITEDHTYDSSKNGGILNPGRNHH